MRTVGVLSLCLGGWLAVVGVMREWQVFREGMVSAFIVIMVAGICAVVFGRRLLPGLAAWARAHFAVLAVCIFALGLVARLAFLALEYAPVSDPADFLRRALTFADTGGETVGDGLFVAMFPHLYGYSCLLGAAFRVFGATGGIVALNTLLDVASVLLLCHLVRRISGSRRLAVLTAAVWWISPYNIVFCAVSLPPVAVNAAFLTVLALLSHLFGSLGDVKKLLPWSGATGLALFAFHVLRPFGAVVFACVGVYFLILVLRRRREGGRNPLRGCLLSLAVMAAVFFSLAAFWQQHVAAETGYPVNAHPQGWNLYIGSNFDSGGNWNQEDSTHALGVVEEEGDVSAAYRRLQAEAFERWRALGAFGAAELIVRKSVILGGSQRSMVSTTAAISYPWFDPEIGAAERARVDALKAVSGAYWFLLFVFALRFFIGRLRRTAPDFSVFLAGFTVVLFCASLAVEVSSRYFMPFFPAFTVFAALGLSAELRAPLRLPRR
ncbi:MAG: hypothetical protein LBR00_00170 [Clostridiales Family XIII bacterium]|nr:hypothetical protein [Clostridiales Family XIII bacterium]